MALVPPLAIDTGVERLIVALPPSDTGDPVTEIPVPFAKVIELLVNAALGTVPKLGSAPVLPKRTVLVAPTATELNELVLLPI